MDLVLAEPAWRKEGFRKRCVSRPRCENTTIIERTDRIGRRRRWSSHPAGAGASPFTPVPNSRRAEAPAAQFTSRRRPAVRAPGQPKPLRFFPSVALNVRQCRPVSVSRCVCVCVCVSVCARVRVLIYHWPPCVFFNAGVRRG